MITAYDNYRQGHASLFSSETEAQLHAASSATVENYLENRLIWKELNHFKENGVVLGKHPIFRRQERINGIRAMKTGDLVNLMIRIDNNLVRNRAALRRQPGHPSTQQRTDRIAELEIERKEVTRLLNL